MAASTSDNRSGSAESAQPRAPWWRRLLFGPGRPDAVPAAVAAPEEDPPLGVPDSVRDEQSMRAADDGQPDQWYAADVHLPADAQPPTGSADQSPASPAAADPPAATTGGDGDPGADDPGAGTDRATTPSGVRRLSNQAVLTGSVTAGPGTTVADAVLVVLDPTGTEVTRGRSGPDGGYELTLPTGGTYLVAVSTQGHRPSIASVTVAADRVEREFALSAISALGGLVRTADGTACPQASVTLIDAGGDVVAVTRTGPDGGYELTDLYPGDYTLTAIVPEAGTTARPVHLSGPSRLTVDVDLPATGTVLGVVTRQGSERPVADAQVAVLDAAGLPAATAVTGEDGAFRIDDLPSGPYTLVASGYAPLARSVRVQAGPGETVDLSLGHQADTAALPRGRHARVDSAPEVAEPTGAITGDAVDTDDASRAGTR